MVPHLYGVFVYGALSLAGLFAFSIFQNSTHGAALSIVACALAWVSQNLHAVGQNDSKAGASVAIGSAVVGIASFLASYGGF